MTEDIRKTVLAIKNLDIEIKVVHPDFGAKFSILVASEKATPMMGNMVATYGMQARSAGSIAINMSVLVIERNKEQAVEKLVSFGRIAKEHGAEVLILGCAVMILDAVEKRLEIQVLDSVLDIFFRQPNPTSFYSEEN